LIIIIIKIKTRARARTRTIIRSLVLLKSWYLLADILDTKNRAE